MALIRPGGGIAQASGRLGGMVFSHNRGGQYVRARSVPCQPGGQYQQNVRDWMSNASSAWGTLDDEGRLAWVSYAQGHPCVNRLGDSIRLAGNAMFVALNSRLLAIGQPIATAPPSTDTPVPLATVTPTFDVGAGDFEVAYTPEPPAWDRIWVMGCLLQSNEMNFVKNRLRHFFTSADKGVSPCDLDAAFTARFGTPVVGNKVVLLVSVIDATSGLLTPALRCEGLVVST